MTMVLRLIEVAMTKFTVIHDSPVSTGEFEMTVNMSPLICECGGIATVKEHIDPVEWGPRFSCIMC